MSDTGQSRLARIRAEFRRQADARRTPGRLENASAEIPQPDRPDNDEDPAVARRLAEAGRFARGGDTISAIRLLEALVSEMPDSVAGHERLRAYYLAERMPDRSAAHCLELARLHSERSDHRRAVESGLLALELQAASRFPTTTLARHVVSSIQRDGIPAIKDREGPLETDEREAWEDEICREVERRVHVCRTGPTCVYEEIVAKHPDSFIGRNDLLQHYIDSRMKYCAAQACAELAWMYRGTGERGEASKLERLGQELYGLELDSARYQELVSLPLPHMFCE